LNATHSICPVNGSQRGISFCSEPVDRAVSVSDLEIHTPQLSYAIFTESARTQAQFAVGYRFEGKTGHVVVDALIAALKVKMQRPEVLIAYVRQQNKRGDTRRPMRRLGNERR
jgi:hypothetical protein